jgi:hypothetical protein
MIMNSAMRLGFIKVNEDGTREATGIDTFAVGAS